MNEIIKTIRPSLKNPAWTPGTPREIFISEAIHLGTERGCSAEAAAAATAADATMPPAALAWWAAMTPKQHKAALREIRRGLPMTFLPTKSL